MYIPIPIVVGAVALILVLMLLRGRRRERGDLLAAPTAAQLPAALTNEVRVLMSKGDKISAIKLVREQSGLGLRESKEFVERLDVNS